MQPVTTWLNRLVSVALATLLVFTFSIAPAAAKSASLEEILTSAGKDYLSSILKGYTESSQGSLGPAVKQAQKLVNGLAEDLEKAADPDIKASERTKILADVGAAKATLTELASSFKGLATDTDTFDKSLEDSVQGLLTLVRKDVRDQFKQNESALEQIAGAIAALSDSAGQITDANLTSSLESFGSNINTLNQALEFGGQAIKATSAFLK